MNKKANNAGQQPATYDMQYTTHNMPWRVDSLRLVATQQIQHPIKQTIDNIQQTIDQIHYAIDIILHAICKIE